MKVYSKHIAFELSGGQVSDLLSALDKMVRLVQVQDKAIAAIINIIAKAMALKIITKQFGHAPQKVKLLTEQAAVLHFLHCNYHPNDFGLNVHERNVVQVLINVIDQKLS